MLLFTAAALFQLTTLSATICLDLTLFLPHRYLLIKLHTIIQDDDASSVAGDGGAGTSPGGDRSSTPRFASRSRSRSRSRRTRSDSESYSMDEIIQKSKDLRAIVDNLLDECGDTGYSP